MRTFLKTFILLSTCLPLLAAAPFEYAPVYTNMTLQPIVGTGNRITSLVGGSTVTNLYTGAGAGFGGFFIWDTNGTIASVDGTNVLDRRIASPVNETHTPGAGTIATGTYYYRVSALTTNPLGETVPSTETSLAVTGPVGINVNWTQIPGATGYKVYGRATGAELFIAQVGKVGTYLDTGAITPSGAMPSTNSTMGVQGTYSRLFERIFGRAGPEGGDLTNDFPNPVLVPIITAAGPIGSATTTPVITYDAKGRLTAVTSVAISGVAPSGAAGGDLSGTYPNPTVDKLDGATVPAAGALTTGNVLQVNGVSSLTYAPVSLAGGVNYVQGSLLVENGGTELVTATANGVIFGNGTGAFQVTAQGGANTVLIANAGAPSFSSAITVGTSVTTPALIATTSLTTPAATISGLTAARFPIVDTGGLIITDPDFTWATDTASFTKVLAPTSVSSPLYISTAAIGITPAAGNNVNVTTSGAGNFAVNTTELVVDTGVGVGIGTATPAVLLDLDKSGSSTTLGGNILLKINGASGAVNTRNEIGFLYSGSGAANSAVIIGTRVVSSSGSGKHAFYIATRDVTTSTLPTSEALTVDTTGSVGIGTTSPLAKLAINGGGGHVGGDSDPGDNNWTVDGLTTTATLSVATSALYSYATVSTIAVFDGSKYLVSGIASAGLTPQYNTGDPNFLGLTGGGDGQLYMNTTTGEKWHWYAAGPYWTP